VILILVLGVLGLMAVIGVTFATFTGQSRISGRNFAQSKVQPQSEQLMDFALSQLICDTNDVRSAIRGHSLARDMYGNDGRRNGYLPSRPDGARMAPGDDAFFYITQISAAATSGQYVLTTNIPQGDPNFYGYSFLRWTIRVAYNGTLSGTTTGVINQTFEVVADGGYVAGSTDPRLLTVVIAPTDASTTLVNPDNTNVSAAGSHVITPASLLLNNLDTDLGANYRMVLDGRWLNAFNGPGWGGDARLGNFRFNAASPAAVGMDEDYDAVDLENWFLAMQSADGQVIIPSFHRPANIRYDTTSSLVDLNNDWSNATSDPSDPTLLRQKISRILRPRQADEHDPLTFPDLIPDATSGKITYDVDNDGDGIADSVWLDLGYPARRNAQGTLYKPLFAFMVVGLNGRLPLNTAGNLAGRGGPEESNATHTSHLGNSVSEIDPSYGLQNAKEDGYSQYDGSAVDVRLTQLRNILAGTRPQADPYNPDLTGAVNGDANRVLMGWDEFKNPVRPYFLPNGIADGTDVDKDGNSPPVNGVLRATNAVPGRWGEPESVPGGSYRLLGPQYNNEVRPGYAISVQDYYGGSGVPFDAADDDYNSFDPSPSIAEVATRLGEVDDRDTYDFAGALLLPVERMRRFLTPVDLNGSGTVVRWNARGAGGANSGPDYWGRVEYRGYYRPPGLPGRINLADGKIEYPWESTDPYPASVPTKQNVDDKKALNNNILHGFETFLNPGLRGTPQRAGGLLAYKSAGDLTPGTPTQMPTYDSRINSGGLDYPADDEDPMSPNIDSRSDGLNDADELNLYNRNPNLDAPFSHADLEWLYRRHDVDGASLGSRLADLAPISFLNDRDSLRRRRLYAIEAWESNAYVWTNDNPADLLGNARFPNNRRFSSSTDNATMDALGAATPALAQRGRKINLNMPLPVSNDPDEPIRRKWITDAYQLMKTVLPPRAVDTPEERAQLGQYLVNLIDFRDPDCTMTRWTNPDVFYVPATGTAPPTVAFTGTIPLVHYGMEYNPIAINEVLAYSFKRKVGTGAAATKVDTPRFFIELVNTLTRPKTGTPTDNAGQVNLSGFVTTGTTPWNRGCWDLVFTEDAVNRRPDPILGQLQPDAPPVGLVPLADPAVTGGDSIINPLTRDNNTAANWTVPLLTIGNALVDSTSETAPYMPNRTLAAQYDPFDPAGGPGGQVQEGVLPTTTATQPNYPSKTITPPTGGASRRYWVCLRRPANPMAPVSAANPMVVVDSMRFPYIASDGLGKTVDPDTDSVDKPETPQLLFSYQRLQPYRGGHAVPVNPAGGGSIDTRYGYTEQIAVPLSPSTTRTKYGTVELLATDGIYHTLGYPNDGNVTTPRATPAVKEFWDFFPFHDRDFTSAFELTLVPGCPPGLFTKQFAEFAPTQTNEDAFKRAAAGSIVTELTGLAANLPALTGAAGANAAAHFLFQGATNPVEPHTFPYLIDKFFYTGANPTGTTDTAYTNATDPATVGGYASDGWFRMFEFFEVPSQMAGAIGPVAQGTNFDWARQDMKAGLLNLNLIIDEEVFLGLLGKQDPGSTPAFRELRMNPYMIPLPDEYAVGLNAKLSQGAWTAPLAAGYPTPPLVVNAIGADNAPSYVHPMSNVGTVAGDPSLGGTERNRMKVAFAQFLWARHGGSGFLFGFGRGDVGQNTAIELPTPPPGAGDPLYLTEIPAERPFRSLSFPDVDATAVRPGTLPPSTFTDPVYNAATTNDPGLRNWTKFPGYDRLTGPVGTNATPYLPPPIPPRRFFQPPDARGGSVSPSNAGLRGDPYVNVIAPAGAGNPTIGGMPPITMPSGTAMNVNDASTNLFIPSANTPADHDAVVLGTGSVAPDMSQHPYFRSEMMQRVMNLTTVRTHQFAVWITVGFFEVKREGDIAMIGSGYPQAAFDVLGPEIGAATSENTRYRSFFVVDRLKLTGFDPDSVGAFRPAVVFRRTIE